MTAQNFATCIDCIAYHPGLPRGTDASPTGTCHLRAELGRIPPTYPICEKFHIKRRSASVVQIPTKPKTHGKPRTTANYQRKQPQRATLDNPVTGEITGESPMDRNGLKQILREILEEETLYGYPDMGDKWEGGTLVLKPSDTNLQSKEMPIDTLFDKIVMIRDRLRVLEAKLNAHKSLSSQEKVEMQQYISKSYGTLTSFNVLFSDKSDHFTSK